MNHNRSIVRQIKTGARKLTGEKVSPGRASGPACVIQSLDEIVKVKPGSILVCDMALPAWTSHFSYISGLVTELGGILSNAAIVAREYRVPAVFGAQYATCYIQDGDMVTVDGNEGIVEIIGAII
ncbi:MAG: PEP-utilizing enzyme [Candidatus Tectomicrobia bacterium]|nr:PEP-utilizing enzyme [Candidatus Tectomicrobia bacterium]